MKQSNTWRFCQLLLDAKRRQDALYRGLAPDSQPATHDKAAEGICPERLFFAGSAPGWRSVALKWSWNLGLADLWPQPARRFADLLRNERALQPTPAPAVRPIPGRAASRRCLARSPSSAGHNRAPPDMRASSRRDGQLGASRRRPTRACASSPQHPQAARSASRPTC